MRSTLLAGCWLATLLSCAAAAARAGDAASPLKVEPALAPDPKVMELINGLGDNSSCLLPPIKTAGSFNDVAKSYHMDKNGPGRRDYCTKMVWAPDRKRALYAGCNHGSPHRLNDAWEYDLPSNTWVLLFAPDPTDAYDQLTIEDYEVKCNDGSVMKQRVFCTKRGAFYANGHTWDGLTYDPEKKALLWMLVADLGGAYRVKQVNAKLQELGVERKDLAPGAPMWAFYPYEKRWRRVCTDKPYTGGGPHHRGAESGSLNYIPELKKDLYFAYAWYWQGMWAYEARSNSWTELKTPGPTPPGGEMVAAYDPDNKVIVAQYAKDFSTWHYDVVANKWEKVLDPKTTPGEHPIGHAGHSVFSYDPVGKLCLLYARYSSLGPDAKPGLFAYDVKERKWTRLAPQGPENPFDKSGPGMSYFDPERNVMVMTNHQTTWLYRYKIAAK